MLISLLLIAAQAADPASPSAPDPTIVVTGAPKTDAEIRKEAQAFVRAVAAAPGSSDQLGRWNQPVCPKVIGGTPSEEKLVLDRVRSLAAEAGVKLSKRKSCAPNILVAFTDDPSGVAREVLARRPHAGRAVPVSARDDLIDGAYPVRWWYDLKVEGRTGQAPSGDSPALLNALDSIGPGVGSGGTFAQSEHQSGNIADYSSSLIGTKSRQSIGAATIIVDVNRMRGVSDDALASFVAMVALAPLKLPPRPVATPSITSLFSDAPDDREADLTDWDRAYLAALYKTAANRTADVQHGAMTARIARQMRGEE
jgi:hypothetical protein